MKSVRNSFIGRKLIPSCLLLAAITTVPALSSTELRSGPQQVAMVELFTSQGCSSCPPADRWMSQLITRDGLWTDYVPLAFHVDYWDDIGWKDPFASPEHSERQRQYADEGSLDFVYTPGFLMNGREWRQSRGATEPRKSEQEVGLLTVHIDSNEASIKFTPLRSNGVTLVANLATLGFGLESNVNAGENGGRKLMNDFVVLDRNHTSMNEKDEHYSAVLHVPKSNIRTTRQAVVVWISAFGSQTPLQAAGGWLADAP